jgi:hypothetical protein
MSPVYCYSSFPRHAEQRATLYELNKPLRMMAQLRGIRFCNRKNHDRARASQSNAMADLPILPARLAPDSRRRRHRFRNQCSGLLIRGRRRMLRHGGIWRTGALFCRDIRPDQCRRSFLGSPVPDNYDPSDAPQNQNAQQRKRKAFYPMPRPPLSDNNAQPHWETPTDNHTRSCTSPTLDQLSELHATRAAAHLRGGSCVRREDPFGRSCGYPTPTPHQCLDQTKGTVESALEKWKA